MRIFEFGNSESQYSEFKLNAEVQRMLCVQNIEIHWNAKQGNGKKVKTKDNFKSQSSKFSENVQRHVLLSESFRNVNKENGNKIEENSNHKTQSTEKRFVVKIFSKCQLEKWKENQGKFRITKAQISEKKPKRMAAFCSESFKNLFGENGKKINFSLTGGDLIDLSAFT